MRRLSRNLQLAVVATCTAIALAVCLAPSLSSSEAPNLASRYPQRGRVARFYGRASQRAVTAPLQTGRPVQWNQGMRPLGW